MSSPKAVTIRQGQIEELALLVDAVPELEQGFDRENAQARLQSAGLLLVATVSDQPAGFKVGYDRFQDGSYYSWLGGVLPEFRGQGVALQLLQHQEDWVREAGFKGIYVKTRNRFVGMRILLARNGYEVVGFNPHADQADSRLLHYKALTQA